MNLKIFSRKNWKEWVIQHEKLVSFVVFVGGFIFDNLTLRRIDKLIDIVVLFGWLLVGSFSIVILNIARYRISRFSLFRKESVFLPLLIPFAFGALLAHC